MEAYAHYTEAMVPGSNTWQNSLAGFLIGSLANSIYSPGPPTPEGGGQMPAAYQQLVLLGSTLASMALGNVNQPDPTVPRAYMKCLQPSQRHGIHYNKDRQFVSQGYTAISDLTKEEYQKPHLSPLHEFGGLFVANETTKPVYFDDIAGMVRRPGVVQQFLDQTKGMTHYSNGVYPANGVDYGA